jgi:hypothetical protein
VARQGGCRRCGRLRLRLRLRPLLLPLGQQPQLQLQVPAGPGAPPGCWLPWGDTRRCGQGALRLLLLLGLLWCSAPL